MLPGGVNIVNVWYFVPAKEWKKSFSSRIHRFQRTSYANITGMRENGYERMPPVEETLASYLSMGRQLL